MKSFHFAGGFAAPWTLLPGAAAPLVLPPICSLGFMFF